LKLQVNFSEEFEVKIVELRNFIYSKDFFPSVYSTGYLFKSNFWPVYENGMKLQETIRIWNDIVPKID